MAILCVAVKYIYFLHSLCSTDTLVVWSVLVSVSQLHALQLIQNDATMITTPVIPHLKYCLQKHMH